MTHPRKAPVSVRPDPALRWRRGARHSLSGGCLAAVVALTVAGGCGTSAKGIEDCRDIERARCEAATACGDIEDVAACQRFYRDHCLHGLSVAAPAHDQVDACVATIQRAATCARSLGGDAPLGACYPEVTAATRGASVACDVVRHPERAEACAFLAPSPDPLVPVVPIPGEGGQGGQPGSGPSSEPTAGDTNEAASGAGGA